MRTKRKAFNQNIAVFGLLILIVVTLVLTTSLSYFTDTKKSSAIIVFGKVNVEAVIIENINANFIIDPQDIVPGGEAYRTLKITCPKDSENFYLRFKSLFKIGSTTSNLITVNVAETTGTNYWSSYADIAQYDASNWKKGTDNKNYYNYSIKRVNNRDAEYYIPLQFVVSEEIGSYVINDETCSMQIIIEVIQEASEGYTGWQNYPSNWPLIN